MMGRRERRQGQFFYSFDLDKAVPSDHLVRQIDGVLDLDWVHKELAPYYSHTGRPSIDPVLMIRMLIVGYVFALRSERRLCSKVRVNLAYRWFCNTIPRIATNSGRSRSAASSQLSTPALQKRFAETFSFQR
jgi:transposase